MICTIRIPDVLQERIDKVSGKRGRSKWILEACRMRLDATELESLHDSVQQQVSKNIEQAILSVGRIQPDMQVAGLDYPGKFRNTSTLKDQLQASIDAIKERQSDPATFIPITEVQICGKTWWEDGEQYECLMDKGHRETKHGMRGMVRRLDV